MQLYTLTITHQILQLKQCMDIQYHNATIAIHATNFITIQTLTWNGFTSSNCWALLSRGTISMYFNTQESSSILMICSVQSNTRNDHNIINTIRNHLEIGLQTVQNIESTTLVSNLSSEIFIANMGLSNLNPQNPLYS